MKPSPTMQQIISALAAKHRVDLSQIEAHLRLEQPPYMPLVIENIGRNRLAIAHYYTQNGDPIADPEVAIFTGYGEYVPIAITQILTGYREYAFLSEDSTAVAQVYPRQQADLASFTEMWARNIREQGWLERGVRPAPPALPPAKVDFPF